MACNTNVLALVKFFGPKKEHSLATLLQQGLLLCSVWRTQSAWTFGVNNFVENNHLITHTSSPLVKIGQYNLLSSKIWACRPWGMVFCGEPHKRGKLPCFNYLAPTFIPQERIAPYIICQLILLTCKFRIFSRVLLSMCNLQLP